MDQDASRQLENQLIVMGLNRLDDAGLVPQMARLIPDHDTFLGMLNECDQEKRTAMYEAMRPHLKFKPYPLDKYIARLKEIASAVDSRANPIKVGEEAYAQVSQESATGVVVDVVCHKCTRTQSFYGDTLIQAAIAAREAGWVRDLTIQKEICPKCPAVRTGKYGQA